MKITEQRKICRRWWSEERQKYRTTGDINARQSMRRAADARARKTGIQA